MNEHILRMLLQLQPEFPVSTIRMASDFFSCDPKKFFETVDNDNNHEKKSRNMKIMMISRVWLESDVCDFFFTLLSSAACFRTAWWIVICTPCCRVCTHKETVQATHTTVAAAPYGKRLPWTTSCKSIGMCVCHTPCSVRMLMAQCLWSLRLSSCIPWSHVCVCVWCIRQRTRTPKCTHKHTNTT